MLIGLSYLNQKAVLQYMEAKRIILSSLCLSPYLQSYEKSLPLHLDSIRITDDIIVVNQEFTGLILEQSNLLHHLFKDRNLISVENLIISKRLFNSKFFPATLKFRVKNLTFGETRTPIFWESLLDKTSFPLKKLSIPIARISATIPLSGFTQNLVIECRAPVRQSHKNEIQRVLTEEIIDYVEVLNFPQLKSLWFELLKIWLAERRAIGTKVTFRTKKPRMKLLEALESSHGGRTVYFKDENGRKRTDIKRATAFPYNQESEIIIYYCKHEEEGWKMCMETVRTGVAIYQYLSAFGWFLLIVDIFLSICIATVVMMFMN